MEEGADRNTFMEKLGWSAERARIASTSTSHEKFLFFFFLPLLHHLVDQQLKAENYSEESLSVNRLAWPSEDPEIILELNLVTHGDGKQTLCFSIQLVLQNAPDERIECAGGGSRGGKTKSK
jgi:hypothetical protein